MPWTTSILPISALPPGFSLDGGWDYLGDKDAAQAKAAAFMQRYNGPRTATIPPGAWRA